MSLTIDELDELVEAAKLNQDDENVLADFIDADPDTWFAYLEFHAQMTVFNEDSEPYEIHPLIETQLAQLKTEAFSHTLILRDSV